MNSILLINIISNISLRHHIKPCYSNEFKHVYPNGCIFNELLIPKMAHPSIGRKFEPMLKNFKNNWTRCRNMFNEIYVIQRFYYICPFLFFYIHKSLDWAYLGINGLCIFSKLHSFIIVINRFVKRLGQMSSFLGYFVFERLPWLI